MSDYSLFIGKSLKIGTLYELFQVNACMTIEDLRRRRRTPSRT